MSNPINEREYELTERLITQIVAKCTCDTKTPVVRFHAVDCTYAAAQMALDVVAAKDERLDALKAENARLRALIRECRLADGHAARTGDESRWNRAFHALCAAERTDQAIVQQEER